MQRECALVAGAQEGLGLGSFAGWCRPIEAARSTGDRTEIGRLVRPVNSSKDNRRSVVQVKGGCIWWEVMPRGD